MARITENGRYTGAVTDLSIKEEDRKRRMWTPMFEVDDI